MINVKTNFFLIIIQFNGKIWENICWFMKNNLHSTPIIIIITNNQFRENVFGNLVRISSKMFWYFFRIFTGFRITIIKWEIFWIIYFIKFSENFSLAYFFLNFLVFFFISSKIFSWFLNNGNNIKINIFKFFPKFAYN